VSRWPVAAFLALVIATVGAFFVTQHLKVTTPLIAGAPAPVPSTINPVSGGSCLLRNGKGKLVAVSFRKMKVSFYLLNRADDVDVTIVGAKDTNTIVDTLPGSGRHLMVKKRREFVWNGRTDEGRIAPDGIYYVRVTLLQQGRFLLISNPAGTEPVTVDTVTPHPVVTSVTPSAISRSAPAPVTIHFAGNDGLRPRVLIYRIGAKGERQVKSYAATSLTGTTVWDGTTANGRPAPAGTYVVALKLTNRACTTGRSATTVAAAPHAVVTVS
jgi:flagellar hook assembly protein FlgD